MVVTTSSTERTLLVLVAVLLGCIAALLTGILVAARDAEPVSAVLAGGSAFIAVIPLVIAIEYALGLLGPPRASGEAPHRQPMPRPAVSDNVLGGGTHDSSRRPERLHDRDQVIP
jgi:hypothetical protein